MNYRAGAGLRDALIEAARALERAGLNRATAGNASVRADGPDGPGFLITPSAMRYDALVAADIVAMALDGTARGTRLPSSEWRFHRDIYRERSAAGAVLHTHSPFATALACVGCEVPAFHYMVARFGGDSVRCAAYATFGTEELSQSALKALEGRCACLLANHGMLVYGSDLDHALKLAIELEALCEQYWRALSIGRPVLLDEREMARVLEKFKTYGQPQHDE